MPLPPIVCVVGATATGKSALALGLAQALGGEIVNTDALQVYRGLDIGTAKLSVAEREGIAHHLIDILEVEETLTVADFQRRARETIATLRARNITPVLVGGSALYNRAIIDDFAFTGTEAALRARYEQTLAELGSASLHRRLAELDPLAATQILPTNGRRIVRALEVIELTGKPYRANLPEHTYLDPKTLQLGALRDRADLNARIERRVHAMWIQGLVDEVAELEPRLRAGRTAQKALGYAQVLRFLSGEISEEQAREDTVTGTRRFARKQLSWYRRDARIAWLDLDLLSAPDCALSRALHLVRECSEE